MLTAIKILLKKLKQTIVFFDGSDKCLGRRLSRMIILLHLSLVKQLRLDFVVAQNIFERSSISQRNSCGDICFSSSALRCQVHAALSCSIILILLHSSYSDDAHSYSSILSVFSAIWLYSNCCLILADTGIRKTGF